jgi:Rho GDP-dissociation inhibitor
MASEQHNEELVPEQTAGFKVGEKKTLDEYNKLGPSQCPPST